MNQTSSTKTLAAPASSERSFSGRADGPAKSILYAIDYQQLEAILSANGK